jgi:hypothetical protein
MGMRMHTFDIQAGERVLCGIVVIVIGQGRTERRRGLRDGLGSGSWRGSGLDDGERAGHWQQGGVYVLLLVSRWRRRGQGRGDRHRLGLDLRHNWYRRGRRCRCRMRCLRRGSGLPMWLGSCCVACGDVLLIQMRRVRI